VLREPSAVSEDFPPAPGYRARETPAAPGSAAARLAGRAELLWERRRTLTRMAACGLALGTFLAFVLQKQYQSTVQLMPPEAHSGSSEMMAALSARAGNGMGALAGDLLEGNSTGALFVGILRSRTIEDRLVERFDLRRVYGEKLKQDARRTLANNTDISEDHKSGIITFSVIDRDPRRAAAIAQAYVEELERLVSELSTSAAHRERVFLEERLKVVKAELDRASTEFSRFASQNAAINIPEQGKAMVEAAAALQGHLIAAESELKGLSEIYTPNNVRVRAVEARVGELRHQLEKPGGNADAGHARDAGDEPSAYPSIRELPLLGVTYADLLRQTRIQETVYETLTQQYELAKVEEAKETPSVKVLDSASVPERKIYPPRLLIVFWCGALGLAAGAAGALAHAEWEKISHGDPRKALAGAMFAAVNAKLPWAAPNGSRLQAMTHRVWVRFAAHRSGVRYRRHEQP